MSYYNGLLSFIMLDVRYIALIDIIGLTYFLYRFVVYDESNVEYFDMLSNLAITMNI